MYDVASDFRILIEKIPTEFLEDMRENLRNSGGNGQAIRAIIFDLSIEILRRKWS